jgi:hypothetical protein
VDPRQCVATIRRGIGDTGARPARPAADYLNLDIIRGTLVGYCNLRLLKPFKGAIFTSKPLQFG